MDVRDENLESRKALHIFFARKSLIKHLKFTSRLHTMNDEKIANEIAQEL